MKRIISLTVVFLLCICLLAVPAFAASASATLTGPGVVRAGDAITLTFNLSGTNIFGASGTLSYDANQLTLAGTNQVIGNGWAVEFNGNNFVAYDNNLAKPVNSNTALFTATFKVKSLSTGTAVKVSFTNVTASDGSADIAIGTVSYSAAIAAPMSTDNALKSLTVSNATISPAFNAGTLNYTAEVPFEVSQLNVTAVANDSKARVSVNSPNLIPNSTTYVTVTVTAENGSTKTYTIAVKRAQDPNYVASSNNNLSGITVDGFLLSPVFSADKTQYLVWLPYETESITVSGTAADSKASVIVEGGANLVAGQDNEVKVICTAEDGTQKVYTVIAKRAAAHGSSTEPTVPPTQPTQPAEPTVPPTTAPATQPTTQPVTPTEPSAPVQPGEAAEGGIPVWVLILVAVVCLGGGFAAGMFLKKKK